MGIPDGRKAAMTRAMAGSIAALLVCASLAACASRDEQAEAERPQPAAAPATAVLRGTVRLAGALVPPHSVVENTTDPQVCGEVQPVNDLLVDPADRGIANVIVALRDPPAAARPPTPSRLVLDNRDCQLVPRVAVLTPGSTIEVVSHDDVLHTVHLYGAVERNIALPDPAVTGSVTIEQPGMIAVLCDVHGWMKAYVRVDAHPFHAVTDEHGAFVIDNVPAGTYELDVWHERLGSQVVPVRVGLDRGDGLEILYSIDGDVAAPSTPRSAGSPTPITDRTRK